MRESRDARWRWMLFCFGTLALVFALIASTAWNCTCEPKVTQDKVRRMATVVWAGSPTTNPPLLAHDNWKNLSVGDAIKTDDTGQAEMQLVDCSGALYVFRDSIIQVSTCTEDEQATGLTTCAQQGTGYFNVDCAARFIVDTPGGRVLIGGTAFSVTYLPKWRLTLVIVFRGRVQVQPVIDFETRKLAPEGIPVDAGRFLYTMPGEISPELEGVPARTPLSVERLPPLVDALQIRDWIDDIGRRAQQDGVLPDEWPFFEKPEVVTISLVAGGGALESGAGQQAVLLALDKDAILGPVLPGEEVAFVSSIGGEDVDARSVAYNPGQAQEMLAEMGYGGGFGARMVFPEGDEQLAVMAGLIAEYVGKVGIDVAMEPVPPEQLGTVFETLRESGTPVLWLARR